MKLSIRNKILLGFALVVLLSYVIHIITYNVISNYYHNQKINLLHDKSQNAANQIENFISRIEIEQLGIGLIYKDQEDSKYIADHIKILIKQSPFINQVSILSPAGRELFKAGKFGPVSNDNLSFEIITDPFNKAVGGRTGLSKVYFSDVEAIPNIDIFTPVLSDQGEVVAVVKSKIQLDRLWDLIAQITIDKTGYAYIVDEEGRLIAHPDINRVLEGDNYSQRAIINSLINGNTLNITDHYYLDEIGNNILANGITITGLNWIVIARQETSEAFQSLDTIRNLYIATILTSLVTLVVISIFLSKQFTRPLLSLKESANLVTKGNLNIDINVKSGDEIEELANSFEKMTQRLKFAFAELQEKIYLLEKQQEKITESGQLLSASEKEIRKTNQQLSFEKEAAEAERNKLNIILSGVTDAVIATDKEGKIITFNPAAQKITGYKNKDVEDKSINKLIKLSNLYQEIPVSEYCPTIRKGYEGIVYRRESLKLIAKEKTSYVNVITGQIKEGYDVNLGNIITMHDVTKEQDLEHMKLDFVSMAAHELRTPLTTVLGYLSFLQEETTMQKMNDEEKEFFNRVNVSAVRLNMLIENLLVVSRIEQGTITFKPQKIQLEPIVERITKELTDLAKTKGLEYNCVLPESELPQVNADEVRMGEVVSNLINNAITYTHAGSVTVSLYSRDDNVIFEVKDTGQGIPKEALPKLFTKFFRIQGELESGSKGTGLGLYISKNIINAHKGKIWVESEPGVGSTFYFSLPKAES